jgi:hypothetical protein
MKRYAPLLLVVLTLGASCGSGSEPEPATRSPVVYPQQAGAGPGDYHITEGRLKPFMDDPAIDPFEKDLIGDGTLTFAEYERAVFAVVECWKEAGAILAEEPRVNARGQYLIYAGAPSALAAEMKPKIDACSAKYMGAITFLWTEHTAPSELEWQNAMKLMAACLTDKGFKDVPPQPEVQVGLFRTYAYIDGVFSVEYEECRAQIEEETGIEGFSG